MMRYPEKPPNSDPINVPTLLIWVSTNYSHGLGEMQFFKIGTGNTITRK